MLARTPEGAPDQQTTLPIRPAPDQPDRGTRPGVRASTTRSVHRIVMPMVTRGTIATPAVRADLRFREALRWAHERLLRCRLNSGNGFRAHADLTSSRRWITDVCRLARPRFVVLSTVVDVVVDSRVQPWEAGRQ